jgi:hypothetical protein
MLPSLAPATWFQASSGEPLVGLFFLLAILAVALWFGYMAWAYRRQPSPPGFLRAGGFYVAPQKLAVEEATGPEPSTCRLRVAWRVRNEYPPARVFEPTWLALEVDGDTYLPEVGEAGQVSIRPRQTVEIATSFVVPVDVAWAVKEGRAAVAMVIWPEAGVGRPPPVGLDLGRLA